MFGSLIVFAVLGHAFATPVLEPSRVPVQVSSKCNDALCNTLRVVISRPRLVEEDMVWPSMLTVLDLVKNQDAMNASLAIKSSNCSFYTPPGQGDSYPVLARCHSLTEGGEYNGLFVDDGKWFSINYDIKTASHVISELDQRLVSVDMEYEEEGIVVVDGAKKQQVADHLKDHGTEQKATAMWESAKAPKSVPALIDEVPKKNIKSPKKNIKHGIPSEREPDGRVHRKQKEKVNVDGAKPQEVKAMAKKGDVVEAAKEPAGFKASYSDHTLHVHVRQSDLNEEDSMPTPVNEVCLIYDDVDSAALFKQAWNRTNGVYTFNPEYSPKAWWYGLFSGVIGVVLLQLIIVAVFYCCTK